MPETPFDQRRYQVRFEWGVEGLARLARPDVAVVVDVLGLSTSVTDALARGETAPLGRGPGGARTPDGDVVAAAAAASGAVVLLGCLRNASAVARAVLAEQHRRGGRTSIAVLAAGEALAEGPASTRFAVEDLLGAGAIIDALGRVGIDHTSPEAAAACEAFRGLRGAMRHLLTAAGSGQQLIDRGCRDDVLAAAALDAAELVPVLRDGEYASS